MRKSLSEREQIVACKEWLKRNNFKILRERKAPCGKIYFDVENKKDGQSIYVLDSKNLMRKTGLNKFTTVMQLPKRSYKEDMLAAVNNNNKREER